MVKMSEAEKNLAWEAWEAAKKQQRELGLTGDAAALGMLPGMPDMAPAAGLEQPTGPARLILTNLPPQITGAWGWGCAGRQDYARGAAPHRGTRTRSPWPAPPHPQHSLQRRTCSPS